MSTYSQDINGQYGRNQLLQQILDGLTIAGIDVNHLSREDLKGFDEFHIGGIIETRNLANRIANLTPDKKILDIGSGLGGPARTLAAEFGNHVVGIDITEEYCKVAEDLTRRVNLSDKITYIHGNALDLPFENNSFDVVWSQFVTMNIEDKMQLYREYQRVLQNDGYFVFHEVIAGNEEKLEYPVFWADNPTISFLKSYEEMINLLSSCGFEEIETEDLTDHSINWFREIANKKNVKPSNRTIGFDIFVGPETPLKVKNLIKNLEENRIRVVQSVFQLK